MGKNRPQIPPPIFTPPAEARPAPASVAPAPEQTRGGDFVAASANPAPMPALAVVPPAPRVAKVELLADRIVLTNPTIQLDVDIFLPGTNTQTKGQRIQPAQAVIMHGEIWIEELGLMWPIGRAHIRTR